METAHINSMELSHVILPLKRTYTNSMSAKSQIDSLILRVGTDTDYTGICTLEFDTPNYSEETWYESMQIIQNEFKKMIIGRNVFDRNLIYRDMSRVVYGHQMSKSLVDSALLDLQGKILGIPAYEMLGGKIRESSEVIGWIGLDLEDRVLSEAEELIAEGYSCLKFKIGPERNRITDMIRKLRSKLGYGFSIRLDANQSLTRSKALSLAQDLVKFEIEFLEQPVNRLDLQSLAFLNRNSPVPIMVDESVITREDMMKIVANEAASFIKVKVFRSGGIERTKEILSIAASSGMECVIGNGFSSSIGTSVEASLALTSSELNMANEFVGPLKLDRDVVSSQIKFHRGSLYLPDSPGFGFSEKQLSNFVQAKQS